MKCKLFLKSCIVLVVYFLRCNFNAFLISFTDVLFVCLSVCLVSLFLCTFSLTCSVHNHFI